MRELRRARHGPAVFAAVFLAVFFLAAMQGAAAPLRAYNFKMAGDQRFTRIVMHFDARPQIDWFLLRDPHRLVVDLPATEFALDSDELGSRGLVGAVQYGATGPDGARLIFSVPGPFSVETVEVLENETSPGFRLIVELRAASEADFEAALRDRLGGSEGAAQAGAATPAREERFTVALDPGHGGADGGARGVNGTAEKTITLIFALELAEKLKERGDFEVVLTRDSDEFLRLDERVQIAQRHDADLFVSIHADAISVRGVRGATVYTVSDEASDAEAAATAARENLSDQIAGQAEDRDKDEVEDILVDLIRRETHSFSIRFARNLIGELSQTTRMVTNPHRYAGFRVLRAPDIPSVLLELGYLSNSSDEEQMRDADWRAEAAEAVISAIELFVEARSGARG